MSMHLNRRQVVVNLILDMKSYGHPSFRNITAEELQGRAAALPQDGVPPEVLKVINELDDSHEKLQPQKAAAPCDGMEADWRIAGETFADQRPRASVAEGQTHHDANHEAIAGLDLLLGEEKDPQAKEEHAAAAAQTLEVRTGNKLVDQFHPGYFAIAFCFCFKYATAWPDNKDFTKQEDENQAPPRRDSEAPKVDIHSWCAAIQRRIEAQFRRDWMLGFALWNFLFRTMVNLQPNTHMHAAADADSGGLRMMSPEEIQKGALEIRQNLRDGKYELNGEMRSVQGDLAKLPFVPNLGVAARKVLLNLEARTRNIPGTHEIRKTMRHETHANRIVYGTSAFVTFSPSERDTCLMLRMVRTRQEDPAIADDRNKSCYNRNAPELDVDYMRLSPEALAEACWGRGPQNKPRNIQ